jgi:protein involved in polysaccharide export with SLBB domain
MRAGSTLRILAVFFCVFFFECAAFSQTPAPPVTPEPTQQISTQDELSLIHFGDLIDVDVLGSIEFDWRGMITPEGFLTSLEALPEPIYGLCRTEDQVARDIAKAYAKLLRDPKVVVKILDRSNRPNSTLFGAVRVPQRFQIKRPVHLNELIILAGGFTDQASGEIQIFRPASLSCTSPTTEKEATTAAEGKSSERFVSARRDNGSQFINIGITDLLGGKKEANVQIMAGDVVTVLEAKPIYVIGGVANPRQIATRSQMTVSRAVAAAGGLSKKGDGTKVTIFRRSAGVTKIIEANLEKIRAKEADDIVLQAFDIVDVPQKGSEKRKYPPFVKIDETDRLNSSKLPLRIID